MHIFAQLVRTLLTDNIMQYKGVSTLAIGLVNKPEKLHLRPVMLFVLFAFQIFPISFPFCPAYAEDPKTYVFTNDDLNKHRAGGKRDSSDRVIPKERAGGKGNQSLGASSDQAKEKWCRYGVYYRGRVAAAKAMLKEMETEYSEAETKMRSIRRRKPYPTSVSQADVRIAKNDVAQAEKELADLEEEAHRNGIPPGWLKCQYSY